jgi:hypothetical protein
VQLASTRTKSVKLPAIPVPLVTRVLPRLFLNVVSSITVPTVKEHPLCAHLVLTLASLQLLQVPAALPVQLDIFATVQAQPQVYTATLVERLRLHLAPQDPTVLPEVSIQ